MRKQIKIYALFEEEESLSLSHLLLVVVLVMHWMGPALLLESVDGLTVERNSAVVASAQVCVAPVPGNLTSAADTKVPV